MKMAETYTDAVAEAREAGADLVLVEHQGAHATVTLNDPEKLNPLSAPLTVALRDRCGSWQRTRRCARSCSPGPIPPSAPAATCA
jgi:hypothetical protein